MRFNLPDTSSKQRTPWLIHDSSGPRVVVSVPGGVFVTHPDRHIDPERATRILYRYITKARTAGLALNLWRMPHLEKIEHFGGGETIPRCAIPITWRQCHAGCAGWLHMADPEEVQACDECARFTVWDRAAELDAAGLPVAGYVTRDDLAREAHAQECGCSWGQSVDQWTEKLPR